MACLTLAEKTELRAKIARLEIRLAALDEAYLSGATEVKSYSLDTNEGKQTMIYRNFADLQLAIDATESRLDLLKRTLNGGALGSMRLRRRCG